MTQGKKLFPIILVFMFMGCSQQLDPNLEGRYFSYLDGGETGIIYVNTGSKRLLGGRSGKCRVEKLDKTGGGSNSTMVGGSCGSDGKTLSVILDSKFSYLPDFQDGVETLTIDGDTLITQSGTRFIREDRKTGMPPPRNKTTASSSYAAPGSSGASVTNGSVENALNLWGMCRGSITAHGVQELPQQNAARAILKFSNCTLRGGHSMFGGGGTPYSGPSEAIFIRFNDGRWVLSKVQTSQGVDSIRWDDLNVEVK